MKLYSKTANLIGMKPIAMDLSSQITYKIFLEYSFKFVSMPQRQQKLKTTICYFRGIKTKQNEYLKTIFNVILDEKLIAIGFIPIG